VDTNVAATRAERLVFTAAAAATALHTAMDTFLAPEPGTAWSDHLAAGVVPLALLGGAVLAYPRLRAGVQAAIALVLAVLAAEGAALAVADASGAGVRADDWTGFLLAPAAAASLVLGLRLLWRSRRPGRLRYLRRVLVAAAAAVATMWVVVPVAVAILATHRPREVGAPVDLGRPSRDVTVETSDGIDLRGRYVASRNGAAVIVLPGSPSRAPQARVLARAGYGVLMLDMRGYGRSDGAPNMFGWDGAKDVDAGIAFLRTRPDVVGGRIGGLGFSVGGEVMLEAAARNPALRAVVADGAGERSVRESALRGPAGWLSLPAYAVQTAAVAIMSGDAPPPSLVDLTPRIAPRGLFLIGAGKDNGGEDLQPHYFAAAREPKRFWKIPEAGHTGGYAARPHEYARRLVAFFDDALLDGRG
jgi:uncharacterized protein